VEDVLKLSQAQVNESITLSYIQNSGTIYDLRPNDIVYLKGQGMSDTVISAMMDQRKKALDSAAQAQAAAAAAQQQQQVADASGAVTAPSTPTYGQSEPIYAEPTYTPESTVYVIPSPAVAYAYYSSYRPYSYGYYGGYYGAPYRYCGPTYCGSSVVVRFGGGGRSYSHGHSVHHH
jgi:type II secretory pathway pseudopilin PulG